MISIVYNHETIVFTNNTFSNIVSSGSENSDCGGLGISISKSEGELTIKYENCKFYDISNKHDGKPKTQGGAIQYGFSNNNYSSNIEIYKCEFKSNIEILFKLNNNNNY